MFYFSTKALNLFFEFLTFNGGSSFLIDFLDALEASSNFFADALLAFSEIGAG